MNLTLQIVYSTKKNTLKIIILYNNQFYNRFKTINNT